MRHRTLVTAFAWLVLCVCTTPARAEEAKDGISTPVYRVETTGFSASEADIRAVLDSASRELWRYFPDYKLEPIVVTRGRLSPITLFKRNERGEIVVQLNTSGPYWCQYAYQYAHELCHVLCGFKEGYAGNKWFEETLCETSSLFVMRAMARTWKTSPPYPNWKDYRDSLREYTDEIMRNRADAYEIDTKGLGGFYRAHQAEMEKSPVIRNLNGAMAVVLLQLFEERPERWEAVRWLNSNPAAAGDSLATYFQKWHDAAPAKHRGFVRKIANLYGATIRSDALEPASGPRHPAQGE